MPDSKAFNSYIGDGFLVPELKGECEASEDEKADSSSEHNVGNGVLFAIGLHGSGDAVALCQELYDVERRSIPVEAVKACALIGLHMMIEEKSGRSENGSSVSSSSSDENNVGNDTLFVIGLHGSGDTIALFQQDWEVAKVALSCHIALDMLCQELDDVERRRGWFRF